MPIYEYKCSACNVIIEEMRNIPDRDNPEPCEKCQGEMVRNKIVAPHLVNFDKIGRSKSE